MNERIEIWWNLDLYHKWEVLGVWLRLRCSACGDWYFKKNPCWADNHDR